jgi:hypothetical protein
MRRLGVGLALENGPDRAVSTVPGWTAMQTASGRLRFSSMAAV